MKKSGKMKEFWKVLLGSIVLLPLLGLTWVFGLLAVNNKLTVFIWIFTVLNSLQVIVLSSQRKTTCRIVGGVAHKLDCCYYANY